MGARRHARQPRAFAAGDVQDGEGGVGGAEGIEEGVHAREREGGGGGGRARARGHAAALVVQQGGQEGV